MQKLNLLVEESEGCLNSDNPLPEDCLRIDSLFGLFARVTSDRADPIEKIPRLRFSQRWGAKVSFDVAISNGEEAWKKLKADIKRNFALQSEKRPGKKGFEVWITCEGLGPPSDDEDEW